MVFVSSIFYWASYQCPDAIPAGIIAVKIGERTNIADENIDFIHNQLCSFGLFDDCSLQLEIPTDEVDLIKRDHAPNLLTSSQILPDWQWDQIKKQQGIRIAEHDLDQYLDEFGCELEESEE